MKVSFDYQLKRFCIIVLLLFLERNIAVEVQKGGLNPGVHYAEVKIHFF